MPVIFFFQCAAINFWIKNSHLTDVISHAMTQVMSYTLKIFSFDALLYFNIFWFTVALQRIKITKYIYNFTSTLIENEWLKTLAVDQKKNHIETIFKNPDN